MTYVVNDYGSGNTGTLNGNVSNMKFSGERGRSFFSNGGGVMVQIP